MYKSIARGQENYKKYTEKSHTPAMVNYFTLTCVMY